MFDVATSGSDLEVTSLRVNVGTTSLINVSVYTKFGTHYGYEADAGAWDLVATGSAIGLGAGLPTLVDITDFILPASTLTGMYVHVDQMVLLYTTESNNFFNDDLNLYLGTSLGGLFGADGYSWPGTWNGTLCYVPIPVQTPTPTMPPTVTPTVPPPVITDVFRDKHAMFLPRFNEWEDWVFGGNLSKGPEQAVVLRRFE